MKKFLIILFTLIYANYLVAQNVVMNIDFDNSNEITEMLVNAYKDKVNGLELSEEYGYNNTKGIRITLQGTDRGSNSFVKVFKLGGTYDEVTLNYRVFFEEDFQFVKGGKLHGVGPANRVTGGKPLTPEGWSSRIMFSRNNTIRPYIYHQNKKTKWGTGGAVKEHFLELGKYHDIAIYTKINSPADQHNGVVEIWCNGERLFRQDDLQLRTVDTPASKIQAFLFSLFYGGHTSDWAPRNPDGSYAKCHLRFDDFTIYEGYYIRK